MMHNANMNLGFGVNVRPMVMKGDEVVREYPLQHNLILDSGLEALYNTPTADCFKNAAVGVGTNPTERSSGVVAATSTNTTLNTVDGVAFFDTTNDVGRVIKFSSGAVRVLKQDGSNTTSQFQITTSLNLTPGETFVIYNVKQTTLQTLSKVSATYRNTGNVENGYSLGNFLSEKSITATRSGTTVTASSTFFTAADVGKYISLSATPGHQYAYSNILTYVSGTQVTINNETSLGTSGTCHIGTYEKFMRWRTFQFTEEVAPVTYTEAGWSWLADCSTLFGRIVFNIPVTVGVGEKLILYVELNTYIDGRIIPIADTNITNMPDVSARSQNAIPGGYINFSTVSTAGTSNNTGIASDGGSVEPFSSITNSEKVNILISSTSTGFNPAAAYSLGTYATFNATPAAYIANTYYRTYVASFSGVSVNLTANWWSIMFCSYQYTVGYRILFNSVQSKSPLKTVTLNFTKSWGRYLG